MLLILISIGYADCVTPTENLEITEDTTLCAGTYYLNDSDTNGVIQIGANDVTLDCNGAELIGNGTASSRGIMSFQKNNITIKNCLINNYTRGINYQDGENSTIFNNTIKNSDLGINLVSTSRYNHISNNNISNSTSRAISLSSNNPNNNITNNHLYLSYYGVWNEKSNYTYIKGNTGSNLTIGVRILDSDYLKVYNNYFYYGTDAVNANSESVTSFSSNIDLKLLTSVFSSSTDNSVLSLRAREVPKKFHITVSGRYHSLTDFNKDQSSFLDSEAMTIKLFLTALSASEFLEPTNSFGKII
jgi:hypothetical protein